MWVGGTFYDLCEKGLLDSIQTNIDFVHTRLYDTVIGLILFCISNQK